MNDSSIKKIKIIIPIFIMIFLSACSQPKTVSGLYFDTLISITTYDNTSQEALNECLQLCSDYELIFSKTNVNSELYAINTRASSLNISEAPDVYCAVLSPELYEVLNTAIEISLDTDQAFTPTLGQVINLWDYKSDSPNVPSNCDIDSALSHSDLSSLSLNPADRTITISDSELTLDLGAIAKGYVADQLKKYLAEHGTREAVIKLAGNIYCIGNKYGQQYSIGIQKPFSADPEPVTTLKVSNTSVVTSGIYERYFEADGVIYHHIIDPATGYPSRSDLTSVTVICDNSTMADALSTAILVMGKEKGIEYIDSQSNVSAVLIDENGNLHTCGSYFNQTASQQ